MNQITFGPIKDVLILGGGNLALNLSVYLKNAGLKVEVITSPRHAVESIDGEAFAKQLTKRCIKHVIVEKLEPGAFSGVSTGEAGTLALSLGAAWIFKKEIIEGIFSGRMLNLHGSLLPRDKGGGGFSWQIMRGNRRGACALHLLEEKVDAGNIVLFEEFLYPSACRKPIEFQDYYIEKNLTFLASFFERVIRGRVTFSTTQQSECFSTYFPRLNTNTNGWINWDWTGQDLERFICAFDDPYSGARTRWRNEIIHLKDVMLQPSERYHPFQTGLVLRNNQRWLQVATEQGELLIQTVLGADGSNLLPKIAEGDRFITGSNDLALGKERVVYTPKVFAPLESTRDSN